MVPQVAPPPIPLRPPAIPKRRKNEKPIPISTRQELQQFRRKTSDPTLPSSSILSASWTRDATDEKLVDLDPFRAQDQRVAQDYTLSFPRKEKANEGNDFVADFGKANFEGECKLGQKTSFEELQKASRDLEKRLHERIVKSAESKLKDQQCGRDGRQRQGGNAQTG